MSKFQYKKSIFFLFLLSFLLYGCQDDGELLHNSIQKWNTINQYADIMYTELGDLYNEDKISNEEKNKFMEKGNVLFDELDDIKHYMLQFGQALQDGNEAMVDRYRARLRSQINRTVFTYNEIREDFMVIYIRERSAYVELPKLERIQ